MIYIYSLALNRRGNNTEGGFAFFLEKHTLGKVVNRWGSMLNKQYGDPNLSKLLKLVVNVVEV